MKYTLVKGDDWEGFYVNGKLITEGHRIELEDIFEILQLNFTEKWVDVDWLDDKGGFTENLEDVVFEIPF